MRWDAEGDACILLLGGSETLAPQGAPQDSFTWGVQTLQPTHTTKSPQGVVVVFISIPIFKSGQTPLTNNSWLVIHPRYDIVLYHFPENFHPSYAASAVRFHCNLTQGAQHLFCSGII